MATQKPAEVRKWYHKKRFLIPIGVVALVTLWGGSNDPAPSYEPPAPILQTQPATSYAATPETKSPTVAAPAKNPAASPRLSNDNYYTNIDGNEVHSPAYSNTGSVPSGASARCRDGSYSFSQHRSGTCSHHGGVAEWL